MALAEQELSAIGKRRRLQEKLDMATSKPKSSFRRNKPARGSPAALNASAKPQRTSLDNVGEREVKVQYESKRHVWPTINYTGCVISEYALFTGGPVVSVHFKNLGFSFMAEPTTLYTMPEAVCSSPKVKDRVEKRFVQLPRDIDEACRAGKPLVPHSTRRLHLRSHHRQVLSLVAGSADSSSGRANEEPAAPGTEDKARSVQRSIPIVDTHTPGTVEISMRAAGVTVVTYLVSSASLAREEGGRGSSQQDVVVTLTEASARQIEACAMMDIVRGTVRRNGIAVVDSLRNALVEIETGVYCIVPLLAREVA